MKPNVKKPRPSSAPVSPRQAQELHARAVNAERREEGTKKERDTLRSFLTELRDDPNVDDTLRRKIQTVLNKSLA